MDTKFMEWEPERIEAHVAKLEAVAEAAKEHMNWRTKYDVHVECCTKCADECYCGRRNKLEEVLNESEMILKDTLKALEAEDVDES